MLETTLIVQLFEKSSEISIVRSFIEAQVSAVTHICGNFLGVAETQLLNRCVYFTLFDLLILVVFIPSPETLPRKFTFQKIEKNIACAF